MIPDVAVRLDRVQLVSWASRGRKPPAIKGFVVTRDTFVRPQTSTATYARCRQYKSLKNNAKIFWQYHRRKGWLKPWKITIVGDDETGLTFKEIERVLTHCRHFRFILVELAIDFNARMGINKNFIRQHAVFGKSRPRGKNKRQFRSLLRNAEI